MTRICDPILNGVCHVIKMGGSTGAPPITLFFGPEKNYRVIGKTVLKED